MQTSIKILREYVRFNGLDVPDDERDEILGDIRILEAAGKVDKDAVLWALDALREYYGYHELEPMEAAIAQIRALLESLPEARGRLHEA